MSKYKVSANTYYRHGVRGYLVFTIMAGFFLISTGCSLTLKPPVDGNTGHFSGGGEISALLRPEIMAGHLRVLSDYCGAKISKRPTGGADGAGAVSCRLQWQNADGKTMNNQSSVSYVIPRRQPMVARAASAKARIKARAQVAKAVREALAL